MVKRNSCHWLCWFLSYYASVFRGPDVSAAVTFICTLCSRATTAPPVMQKSFLYIRPVSLLQDAGSLGIDESIPFLSNRFLFYGMRSLPNTMFLLLYIY